MRTLEQKLKTYRSATFLLLLILFLGVLSLPKFFRSFCPETKSLLEERTKPSASALIEKIFEFPISKNSQDKFGLVLVKAEKMKMVTTQNQPVTAKKDEEFLLIYLEVENNGQASITVDSQNYFRLVTEQDKRFAPDFYNGPIQIAAVATKKDQIGFVVVENQKAFKIQVGEPDGEKEIVEFQF